LYGYVHGNNIGSIGLGAPTQCWDGPYGPGGYASRPEVPKHNVWDPPNQKGSISLRSRLIPIKVTNLKGYLRAPSGSLYNH